MKHFTKNIEDFKCGHCGANVVGNGYTNHCPRCLWSRDVDINPGDRRSPCGGLMRPIHLETVRDDYIITHKCEKCGKERRQKTADDDDMDEIIRLGANPTFVFGA